MKETTKMSRAVSQLEHIYNALNTDFFDGLLPVPIITVQSKPGTYGHCTTAKVWQRKDGVLQTKVNRKNEKSPAKFTRPKMGITKQAGEKSHRQPG